jgi:VanZ family protein
VSSGIQKRERPGGALRRQYPYLAPMLAWMAVIALLSTDLGSKQHTTDHLVSVARWLFPHVPERDLGTQLELLSWAVRKFSHLSEYAILAFLVCRWLNFLSGQARRTWQGGGMAISGLYAVLDEFHQTFVSTRSGSAGDVLVDWAGAVIGMSLFTWYALRGRRQR